MLLTSRRERSGAERLVVAPLGIARLPLADPDEHTRLDSIVVPWGQATAVELRRVSPVWYRLRIGDFAPPGGAVTNAILDAGVRCPDDLAPDVRRTIEWHLQQAHSAAPLDPPSSERPVESSKKT